jgi:CRP-like cAMP-binding protein
MATGRSRRNDSSTRPTPDGPGVPPRTSNQNLVLASLPDADYARLSPMLDVVSPKLRVLLHRPGDAVQHVYFPGAGFCSELAVLEDGTMVEVATTGREGVAGLLNGSRDGPVWSALMVQGPMATCYRLGAAMFRTEMERRGAFHTAVSAYSDVLTRLVMQSTACNAVHGVEQRLARWLLTAQDHMGSESFPLTQDFVAMMLGAARPTVAIVAGKLQKAGLITYRRGNVTVVDREQLEAAACECYRTTADLMGTLATAERG